MKKRTPISEIMTKNVISLKTNDDLEKAESLFKKNNIRHIPVVSGKEIVGISFADAIDDYAEDVDTVVYNMFTIEQVMAKKLITVSSDTTIKEVAEILAEKEFHALPVVDNEILVGIVTTTDLIKYLINQY